jgi:hypothetical protein
VRPKRKWDRYEYDVQHHFGLQGKRVAAPPLPCGDVVNHFGPKPAAHGLGGCPFAALSAPALTRALTRSYAPAGSSSSSGGPGAAGPALGGGLSSAAAAALAARAAALHSPTPTADEGGGSLGGGFGGGGRAASGAMSLCCQHFDAQHAETARGRRRPPPQSLAALLAANPATRAAAMHPHLWAEASERLQREWRHAATMDPLGDADEDEGLGGGADDTEGDGGPQSGPCGDPGLGW